MGETSAQRAAPGRAGKIYGSARKRKNQAKFSIFEVQQAYDFFDKFSSRDSMTPKLGHTKLWQYAFVERYDTTNRKPYARKQWEKYGWTKRIHRFRKIRG